VLWVFIRVLHFGRTSKGEIYGPPSRNPIIGKARATPGRSPGIPGGAVRDRFAHCHSSHRHGNHIVGLGFFSRFTPLDPLCSVQTGSPRVGYGSSPCTDGLEC